MLTLTSDALINDLALVAMLLGAYALYLCYMSYPARRKR